MHESGQHGLLLVDSDAFERRRLQRELEASGWTVWTAADEPSAIRVIAEKKTSIEAALVDLQLPGFQGRRVMAELEHLDPRPICMAMSTGISRPAIEAFRQISGAPLLLKPVDREQLDSALSVHDEQK